MTSAPAKPPTTSAQRSADTRSCSSHAASSVTITGVSMTIAVNSGTGMCCTPKKLIALVTSNSVPRSHWNFRCAARKPARLERISHSAITLAWNA